VSVERLLKAAGSAGVVVTLAAAASLAAENKLPRRELAPIEQALAEAVSRVSVSALPMVGVTEEVCRGYRLPGFGALFVVSPRYVPPRVAMKTQAAGESDVARVDRELSRSIGHMEESLQNASTDKDKQELTDGIGRLRDQQRQLRQRTIAERQIEREILAYEAQVETMHQQALKAQREAEEAMTQMLGHIGMVQPGAAADVRSTAVAMSSHAIPPWVNWVRTPAEDTRTPDQVLSEVRQALMDVLEKHGADVESLEPDEVVAVAVDFVTTSAADGTHPPTRTLVLRVPKSVLDAARAGKLASEEARKQYQVAEY
jgi:hypothetical protein